MDRLTTGRRHVRAGSVSVTELITKQADRPESPAPVTASPAVANDAPITPEPGPTSHRRTSSRGAQLAKMTSLGAATVVLCGAVVMASAIARQRQDDGAPAERPAEQISGEQALLPDELNHSLTRDGAAAVPPPSPKPITRAPRAATPPPPRTSALPTKTTTPVAAAPVSDLDVVKQFYEVVPNDPAAAFNLISPDLLHSTLGQFLESWSRVRSVEVLGLRRQADSVLAVVRMRLADGGHLQLQQLLTVAESPRRIVAVELLSAQRN